jgi:DNA-directed RNA polymerase specialized sigma24 family protein
VTAEPTRAGRSAGGTPFDRACFEAVRLLLIQQHKDLRPQDVDLLNTSLTTVVDMLPRLLLTRVDGGLYDAQDVAQDAMARFMRAVQVGQVSLELSPSGYLLTIAVNVIRDRRRRPPLPLPAMDFVLQTSNESHDGVEAVAKLLDAMASLDQIRAAIAYAGEVGDVTTLEVVTAWLDMAGASSAAPSTREVALVLGIGKSTVANALRRFASYVSATRDS